MLGREPLDLDQRAERGQEREEDRARGDPARRAARQARESRARSTSMPASGNASTSQP